VHGLNERLASLAHRDGLNLHGVVVTRQRRLVGEYYGAGEDFAWGRPLGLVRFGPDTPHDVRSVTKSVVALLYGIALDRGQVPAPEEPLLGHFPEYADLAADPRRAALTVEHALTMTLAVEWDESVPYTSAANSEIAMELAPDRYRYVLERPITGEPGRQWSYCGGASAVLGQLIHKGTGQPLPDFAREVLFEPLGIDAFEWMTGADGVASAASGLRLTPRGLARIGQLVLDAGRNDAGGNVVSSAWLEAMLRPRVRIDEQRDYGYQWYLTTEAESYRRFAASGNGGQRLFVLPDLELVVAITAGGYDTADQSATPDAVLDEVVGHRESPTP
jgi:CubicO group peptidase (beta-lactamase class C family)